MLIIDKDALATPRSPLCEYCGRPARTERHHIIARGIGGGSRLDVPENLLDLGGAWDCGCHVKAGANLIKRATLLLIVARREDRSVQWLERFLTALLQAPKGSDVDEIRATVSRSVHQEEMS